MRAIAVALAVTLSAPSLAASPNPTVKVKAKEEPKPQFIECTKAGVAPILIKLNIRREYGVILSCIDGDFIADMTPCAPEGGWGLSVPTGSASLARVFIPTMWWEKFSHLGGVMFFSMNDTQFFFRGGFQQSTEFEELWSFKAERMTGVGTLDVSSKDPTNSMAMLAGKYECRAITRKF